MGRFDHRILAALLGTLAAAAHAQTPPAASPGSELGPAPGSGEGAQQSPRSRDAQGGEGGASASTAGPPMRLAADVPGVSAGMPVQSDVGTPLGFVVDVLPGPDGTQESGYVVIAGGAGGVTPVPYSVARSMVQDGMVVIEEQRFAAAPKVSQSQIEDPAAAGWKAKVKSYWNSSPAEPGAGDRPQDNGDPPDTNKPPEP